MPLPLRFVPRASCLSSAYLLSVYEDCDWFCMEWRAGSGNRCCFPSWIGFEMGMHCIIDSSSGSLRRSLCVSFVVVCEDCVFRLVLHFESVRVLLVVRVVPFLVLVFRMFLSGSAVPLLCLCNSPAIHLLCIFSACPFQQTPLKSTLPALPLASSSFAIPAARW